MARDPKLVNALLNVPSNWLSQLEDLVLRVEQLEVSSIPQPEVISGGRLSIADLILSPAQSVQIAEPTNTGYTGAFMAGQGIEFNSVRYVLGNVVNGQIKTGFTDVGTLFATDAVISGSITAETGFIGGWEITATTIESLAANVGIILDSSVPKIQVGDTSSTHIVIDGDNQWIRSSNFVAGAAGFNIDASTGDAEFNNLIARGELRTFLLTSSNQMAVAGNILVSKDAGKLGADAASGSTTVDFGKTLTVGDWIKIQGADSAGSNSLEWMLIGSLVSGTTYNVTRNVDGSGANNWLKDTPFVVIGSNGDSRIELVAGASASLQLITQGVAWNQQTIQASMSTVEGAITAGNGAVALDENGITLPDAGDAIELSDSLWKQHAHIYLDNNNFFIRSFRVNSETSLLANGDFETGDFTSWTETDPSSKIAVVLDDGDYVADFANADISTEYIEQSAAATYGCVVTFRVKASANGGTMQIVPSSGSTQEVRAYTEWRNQVVVFDQAITSLRFGTTPGTAHVYIDDIIVRPKAAPVAASPIIRMGQSQLDIAAATIVFTGAVSGSGLNTIQQLFTHGLDAGVPASTTYYLNLGNISGLQTAISNITLLRACVAQNLSFTTNSAQPASGSLVITLMKNGVATAITITVAAGAAAATFSDITHTVSFVATDAISLQIVNNATGTSALITRVAMELKY